MLYPKLSKTRTYINIDGFWRFREDRDNVGENESWYEGLLHYREIAVPSSWNEQYIDLFDFHGKGWYEKEVFISKEWKNKHIYIRVGSAWNNSKAWINGISVGVHEGGHLPFEFNITNDVKLEEMNKIVILVDGSLDPWGLPPAYLNGNEGRAGFFNSYPPVTYDFYPFAGLHRSVYLYATSSNRLEDIIIKTDIDGQKGIVKYKAVFTEPLNGSISVSVDGIKNEHSLKNEYIIAGELSIQNARLWDIGVPNMYELKVELYNENLLIDDYEQTFGIRTVKIDKNKLLLNGREIFLKGFGKHEDFAIIGKGLNHSVIVKDFDLLKWTGANSFRTSHYPYAEEMMDYADRNGMLVIDETPFVGFNERMYEESILEKAKGVIKELITRDKNHPCVIMWSLANEPNASSDRAEHFFKGLVESAKELDNTRPITYVAHLEPENNKGMKYYDVVCINKYYGWYELPGNIDVGLIEMGKCLDRFYDAFKKPMILAEFGADAIEGMHQLSSQMFSEEYQADIIVKQYNLAKSKEYCIGTHIWCFADFKTAQSISRIIYNRKGVFTRDRQPKYAAHKVKEMWKEN